MLKVKVKANSITNLTDARYFAAREAEWLGFRLEPGAENFIEPAAVKAIKEWVDGVKIAGEFGLTNAAGIKEGVRLIGLDAVQVGMFTPKEELAGVRDVPIIKEVIIEPETAESEILEHLLDYSPFCDVFLLRFQEPGVSWPDLQRGHPFTPAFLHALCEHNKVLLDLDLSAGILEEVLKKIHPMGLALSGGAEEKAGYKSFDELDEIFDILEE
jgi:phosphoribosylanthranilate isomerase